ncbi:MAG: FkbM family methyltransferase [Anaerolineae bacterium]|nr:FkbM family methyltransferase [Anaerolineae bacterium]
MNFSGISRTSVVGMLARIPLRLIPPNTVLPVLQGELRGYKWIAGSSTHGCWLGSYEFKKQRLLSSLIPQASIVYDIGAHVGYYTLLFSKLVGDQGKVVAFEPLPENVKYLKSHIQLNRISNVTLFEVAVAKEPGTIFFRKVPDRSQGYIVQLPLGNDLQVSQVSIDRLVLSGEIAPPTHLKIDIEGAELLALKGAMDTLRNHRPMIFLATHGTEVHDACCKLLYGLGYELSPIVGETVATTDEILAK